MNDTYTLYGKAYPVEVYLCPHTNQIVEKEHKNAKPLVGIKMMSDFKWQYLCLIRRLKCQNDTSAEENKKVAERLKQWLKDNIAHINELSPEEQINLKKILYGKDFENVL